MYYVVMLAGCVLMLLILDRAIAFALWWLAPFLPNDVAGPDGWLTDTRRRRGVFDRQP